MAEIKEIRGLKFTDEATAKAYLAEVGEDGTVTVKPIEKPDFPIKANPEHAAQVEKHATRGIIVAANDKTSKIVVASGSAPKVEVIGVPAEEIQPAPEQPTEKEPAKKEEEEPVPVKEEAPVEVKAKSVETKSHKK